MELGQVSWNPNTDRNKQISEIPMFTTWPACQHTTPEYTHTNTHTLMYSHKLYMRTHGCECTVYVLDPETHM